MVRAKRTTDASSTRHRDSYRGALAKRRARCERWARAGHSHEPREGWTCLACCAERELDRIAGQLAAVEAGIPVVARGDQLGLTLLRDPQDYALEADGTVTPVKSVRDGSSSTVTHWLRPDGSRVDPHHEVLARATDRKDH